MTSSNTYSTPPISVSGRKLLLFTLFTALATCGTPQESHAAPQAANTIEAQEQYWKAFADGLEDGCRNKNPSHAAKYTKEITADPAYAGYSLARYQARMNKEEACAADGLALYQSSYIAPERK